MKPKMPFDFIHNITFIKDVI